MNIIFENSQIIICNKPSGMLSQKGMTDDLSLTDLLRLHLTQSNSDSSEIALCNRLDRGTSGLIVAAKTTEDLRTINQLFSEHTIKKYYLCLVKGHFPKAVTKEAYLRKRTSRNKVDIFDSPTEGSFPICTSFEPLAGNEKVSLLRVRLHTGKPHQIRAHLKHLGFPIVGDGKYGDHRLNQQLKKEHNLTHPLLHSFQLYFPQMDGVYAPLSHQFFSAPLPEDFISILDKENLIKSLQSDMISLLQVPVDDSLQ